MTPPTDANGWKPGPPPLDQPGRYLIASYRPAGPVVDWCMIDENGDVGMAISGGPLHRKARATGSDMHYGPIPEPPSKETP